jgi:hypothetical protein
MKLFLAFLFVIIAGCDKQPWPECDGSYVTIESQNSTMISLMGFVNEYTCSNDQFYQCLSVFIPQTKQHFNLDYVTPNGNNCNWSVDPSTNHTVQVYCWCSAYGNITFSYGPSLLFLNSIF